MNTNKYVKNDKFLYPIKSLNNKPKSNDPSYKQIIAKKALNYLSPNLNVILGQGIPELVGVYIRENRKKYSKT